MWLLAVMLSTCLEANITVWMQDLAQTDKRWTIHPKMEKMKALAKAQGLWNLWISPSLADCMREVVAESSEPGLLGAGLSNLVGHIFPSHVTDHSRPFFFVV